ncbi:hypothetical protein LSH36_317g00018, partial [Paralvinella palmiformis]
NYKHDIIIGTDQNFIYIKRDQHKNTHVLQDIFITNGFLPTITKFTRITHESATLIENIYVSTKRKPYIHSDILDVNISDHLPVIICVGCDIRINKNKPKITMSRNINETAKSKINTLKSTSF